ncbi:MAG: hypothetical protein ACP5Q5_10240 [Brevinematia bacterium]
MNKILFSRINRLRNERFQVETRIVEQDYKKFVIKSSLSPESYSHLREILNGYEKVKKNIKDNKDFLLPAIISYSDSEITIEYIDGKSYADLLVEAILKGDKKKFQNYILDFRNLIIKNFGLSDSESGKNWFEFFEEKEIEFFKDSQLLELGVIDLIFENVIVNSDRLYLIDLEWVFDGIIPVDFLLYRGIIYFYYKFDFIERFYPKRLVFDIFDIRGQKLKIFEEVEKRFQSHVYKVGFNLLKSNYLKKKFYFQELEHFYLSTSYKNFSFAQLFFDIGNGFNEKDSFTIWLDLTNKKQTLTFDLKSIKNIKALRFDPFAGPVVIEIHNVELFNKKGGINLQNKLTTNAILSYTESSSYFFETSDPQIYFEVDSKIFDKASYIRFDLSYVHILDEALHVTARQIFAERDSYIKLNTKLEEEIEAKGKKIGELEEEIEAKGKKIGELEDEIVGYVTSKSWKITRPLRLAKRILKRLFLGR